MTTNMLALAMSVLLHLNGHSINCCDGVTVDKNNKTLPKPIACLLYTIWTEFATQIQQMASGSRKYL